MEEKELIMKCIEETHGYTKLDEFNLTQDYDTFLRILATKDSLKIKYGKKYKITITEIE